MAAVGVRTTGVLAGALAAVAFALLLHTSSARRPLAGSVAGAVCIALSLVSGRVTYTLGLAVGLCALVALPRHPPATPSRRWAAALLALLATTASPVAGLFTGLAGAALLLTGRRVDGLALALPAAAGLAVVGGLFGQGGVNAISPEDTVTAVVLSAAAGLAAPHRRVRAGAALLAAGILASYVVDTPVGGNAVRLPVMLAVPVVVACAPWRPVLVAVATGGLLAVRLPVQTSDLRGAGDPVTRTAYFAPVAQELARRAPTGRVEAVPTLDYWEAVHVAAVAPLARGWLRQQDTQRGALFFDGTLGPATYEAWLRDTGVQYVALPDGPIAFVGRPEAALVRGGLPFLSEVWRGGVWRLYEVSGAPALADGATVLSSTASEVALRVDTPGDVLVRVQPSRWLTLSGDGCLAPAGRWVTLQARTPGTYVVGSRLQVRASARC